MLSCLSRTVNYRQPANLAAPLNRGRVAWWKVLRGGPFQGGPKLLDLIGCSKGLRTNDGTLTNGPLWKGPSRPGGYGSLSFDGTNDHINCGSSASLMQTGNMTAAGWFNTATVALGQKAIFGTDNSGVSTAYILEVNRTAAKTAVIWGSAVILTGSITLSANTWYHIALTRSGSAGSWLATLYLNGAIDSSTTATTNPTSGGVFFIGARAAGGSEQFNGQIDGPSVYSRALSAADVAALYQEERAGCPTTLNWQPPRTWFVGASAAATAPTLPPAFTRQGINSSRAFTGF